MAITQPTADQVAAFTRMARDLPSDDISRLLDVIQEAGSTTPGAAVIRRAIAEILGLRAYIRYMGVAK